MTYFSGHVHFKNPKQVRVWLVGYLQAWPRSWTRVYRETTPAKWSERNLNPRPTDFKSDALTTLPRWTNFIIKNDFVLLSNNMKDQRCTVAKWLSSIYFTMIDSYNLFSNLTSQNLTVLSKCPLATCDLNVGKIKQHKNTLFTFYLISVCWVRWKDRPTLFVKSVGQQSY